MCLSLCVSVCVKFEFDRDRFDRATAGILLSSYESA